LGGKIPFIILLLRKKPTIWKMAYYGQALEWKNYYNLHPHLRTFVNLFENCPEFAEF